MKKRGFGVAFMFVFAFVFIFGFDGVEAKAKVKLNKSKITLKVGKSYKLKVKGTKKAAKWSSTNKKIASVKKGKVTAKKKGSCKIVAKIGKKKYKCSVKVQSKTTDKENTKTDDTKTEDKEKIEETPSLLGLSNKTVSTNVGTRLGVTLYGGAITAYGNAKQNEFQKEMSVNSGEAIFLTLSFVNKKRDTFLEIVINDSDYGPKQIYTPTSEKYKIASADTSYDSSRDCYVTDVILMLPKSKSKSRTIQIEEAVFHRASLGKQGYCDLDEAYSKSIILNESVTRVATSPYYFKLAENDDDSFTIKSFNANYNYPDTIYIPESFDGKPITCIDGNAFKNAKFSTLIVPNSIKKIDGDFEIPDLKKLVWDSNAETNFNQKRIDNVIVGSNVQKIGKNMFCDLFKIETITLEKGIKCIEYGGFQYASISSLVIPESVESIDEYAFAFTGLSKINIPKNVKSIHLSIVYNTGCDVYFEAEDVQLTSEVYHEGLEWSGKLYVKNQKVYDAFVKAGVPAEKISTNFGW